MKSTLIARSHFVRFIRDIRNLRDLILLLSRELVIFLLRHEFVELSLVGELDLCNPPLGFRAFVDSAWLLLQDVIGLDDLAANRRVDVSGRLYALDRSD